ncbi:MAG: LysR family transcriptional regulator, partial [Butyricicoccaceae bacterium]
MNLTHLKYALEVERTGSITKAAENLAMGQPNLSRVIKELEDTTGIRIFSRTPKGIVPTENGRIFLERAAEIVRQTQELENLFRDGSGRRQTFRVAGQSSNTLLHAFTRTARLLSDTGNYD